MYPSAMLSYVLGLSEHRYYRQYSRFTSLLRLNVLAFSVQC